VAVPFISGMQDPCDRSNRRSFLQSGVKVSAGIVAIGGARQSSAKSTELPQNTEVAFPIELSRLPTRVFVDDDGRGLKPTARHGSRFSSRSVEVECNANDDNTDVAVTCPKGPLTRVVLRWEVQLPVDALYLGDHWERGYGDLQWRFLQPERVMPWYFATHRPGLRDTFLAGVKTQPATMCFWTGDAEGISLWMDFSNGGGPCHPGNRRIAAATIISRYVTDETPLAALTKFCKELCPQPRLTKTPICGSNNWYYAYGQNFDSAAMLRDAEFLAALADGHEVRPYCVIDAGWTTAESACHGGPWKAGDGIRFPDMPGLATEMKRLGVRPGIWMRPTALTVVDHQWRLRPGPISVPEKPLDLTLPENLESIRKDVARVCCWGYDLIKHDFSTFDLLGKWGFEMGADFTERGWNFHDDSFTNAEILLQYYRTLREAAGDAVLLGCNAIGHLGAGLFEIQRTGDDTSGRVWERTRRMGINTLAFRIPQHRTFFSCDADCVAHTELTPWEMDRQFLDLVARSGTALFVSTDPRKVTLEQKSAFREAMRTALSGGEPGGAEPLDWLYTTCPRIWRVGDKTVAYRWEELIGAYPLRV
jgi:alpha-galactosidase